MPQKSTATTGSSAGGSEPLDYESPVQAPPGWRGVLRVRHDEPLSRRHVIVVLLALGLLSAFLLAMFVLFPMGG